jgi:oxygen-independent coproporphyrinogen-3 oxidase
VLDTSQLERIFKVVRSQFEVQADVEVTVECAPGTLTPGMIDVMLRCGVNRVSLGLQSFMDQETAAVGRLHKATTVLDDIARLRSAGIANINIDLIAGLPHQTAESWGSSLDETIDTDVPHVSVYMLEVDEDSRLGRELMAGGTRYHAHFAPDEDATVDFYEAACDRLNAAGVTQYEISNFARDGFESRHNLKYWTRQPYFGFGMDAHSMLPTSNPLEAVRFSTPDVLEQYVANGPLNCAHVDKCAALEETFFLGLRPTRGINLQELAANFGAGAIAGLRERIEDLIEDELLRRDGDWISLTARGRVLSNEVFQRFISLKESAGDCNRVSI